jgi:glutathione S-transferase
MRSLFPNSVLNTDTNQKNLTSAIDRYSNEVKRVTGVIDAHLKKQGTPYLVGDKVTYADLAWIPWQGMYGFMIPGWDYATEYPAFAAWAKSLVERPAVKKIYAQKEFQRT